MILPLIAALALFAAPAKPTLLLYQEQVQEFTEKDNNLDVVHVMAVNLFDGGKVLPVVWATDDALINTALRSGEIKKWNANPSRDELFQAARVLRAEYIALCKVQRKGGELSGEIELVRQKGKSIWSSKTTVSIIKDGKVDAESGAMSIATTWVAQLDTIPFKDFTGSPKIPSPNPAGANVIPAPRIEIDKTPLASGKKALSEGRLPEAVALLRDAVDAAPMDVDARLTLIDALRRAGHPFLAAEEAARAAELMPDKNELTLAAAQSWLDGGQPDKAYENIQVALAKNPDDPAALAIFADLLVGRLEFSRAVETYSKSIKLKSDPEVLYRRAQAYALMENFDKSLADIDAATQTGLSQDPDIAARRYRDNVKLMEPVFDSFGASIRNLLREAKGAAVTADVKARATALVARAEAFQKYIDHIIPPAQHTKSHEQRGLAMNLLYQAAIGVQRYTADQSSDSYGDADLLQIEAMREFAAAKSRFQQEVGTPRS